MRASQEQLEIISQFENKNIIVDAVAGSGKTTTILFIAQKYPENILLLTYNKRLKMETRNKKNLLNINNLEVHSYHSYCNNYYSRCWNDFDMLKIINTRVPSKNKKTYKYLILDEAQDITPLYYELVLRIRNPDLKICLLGDKKQTIFDFNHADNRFLLFGNILFNNNFTWLNTKLSTSFRLTHQTAEFINNIVLGEPRIQTIKQGTKPRYIITDSFGYKTNFPFREVLYYLTQKKFNPENIFILAPSVRSKSSPIRQLANKLSDAGYKIYVPNSDEEKLDDDLLKKKIVFSTFHQVKGLERPVVIVFNFDSSYFRFYKKYSDRQVCPNELYVALTRSQQYLSIIHHHNNNYLPFLDLDKLKLYTEFIQDSQLKIRDFKETDPDYRPLRVSDMELARHLPLNIVLETSKYFEIKPINNRDNLIAITGKSKQGDIYESVYDINSKAISAYYELISKNTMTIFEYAKKKIQKKSDSLYNIPYSFTDGIPNKITPPEINLENINLTNLSIPELLYISNEYVSLITGFNFKLNQIKSYNWLTPQNLNLFINRLKNNIPADSKYEIPLEIQIDPESEIRLIGHINCVHQNNIYEIRSVDNLTDSHYLLLAIHAYLYESHILELYQTIKLNIQNYNYKIGDQIGFLNNSEKLTGNISAIFNNGNFKIDSNSKNYKISRAQIISNSFQNSEKPKYNYYIYNIATNELCQLNSDYPKLKSLIIFLIEYKFSNKTKKTDEEFIKNMMEIYDLYCPALPTPSV